MTAQAPTEAAETGGSLRDRPATEAKGEPTDRGRDVVTAEREICPTLTSPSHAPGTGQLTATPIASIEDGWSAESASARPDALNPRPNADSQELGNAGATAPTKTLPPNLLPRIVSERQDGQTEPRLRVLKSSPNSARRTIRCRSSWAVAVVRCPTGFRRDRCRNRRL